MNEPKGWARVWDLENKNIIPFHKSHSRLLKSVTQLIAIAILLLPDGVD